MDDIDQFQMLEEKIDNFIELITALKREKESLAEKIQVQERQISDMVEQLEALRSAREMAREKIVSLLEKIEQIEI
ncbi:MAG: cell division protein ZapB [Thermodesulfobacteriota bacterium]|nr:cell division protein ZapB [Thermodesulfobacteriota bacterium]